MSTGHADFGHTGLDGAARLDHRMRGVVGAAAAHLGTEPRHQGTPRPQLSLVPARIEPDRRETMPGYGLTPEDEQWQEHALCAQTDPEAFFPEKGGSTREAKRICLGCDVRDACLDYALANDERFGIWGGLSERERRRLKRGVI